MKKFDLPASFAMLHNMRSSLHYSPTIFSPTRRVEETTPGLVKATRWEDEDDDNIKRLLN